MKTRLLCVLGYAAFLRASELHVCSIKSLEIKFHDDYVIDIRSSKQDTYRRGNSVQKGNTKSNALFPQFNAFKSKDCVNCDWLIYHNYICMWESLNNVISEVEEDG